MYVRYLQHQHYGTVQLLMMPLSTAAGSVKSSKLSEKADDEDIIECEPVPLPIQTFLWRQTNPFLGAKSVKLHEASCVTFERVVVQNILHGLSPSLSDAISSVSRWRFVRAAFPHIIQCCASLLSERTADDSSLPMSGSFAKIMYIMHWLLIDSAAECNESSLAESAEGCISVRNLAFPVASVQLFVYLLAPLYNHVSEGEIESHIRLESGLKLWQSLWQCRTPDILCFCAPVKQRRCQLPQVTLSKKLPQATAIEQGIYLGDENTVTTRRLSQLPQISLPVPPPKPPRTDLAVLKEIQLKQEAERQQRLKRTKAGIASLQPANSTPSAIKSVASPSTSEKQEPSPTAPSVNGESGNKASHAIVRSVSDYKTSDVAAEIQDKFGIKKSQTDQFHRSPDYSDSDILNGLCEIDAAMRFMENTSISDMFQLSGDRAPIVQIHDICESASIDASDVRSIANAPETVVEAETSQPSVPKCEIPEVPIITTTEKSASNSQSNSAHEESISVTSQQTVINCTPKPKPKPQPISREATARDSASMQSSDKLDNLGVVDPHEACYLDVAVLRCLLIKNWAEEGVFWSLKYILNRLTEIKYYRMIHESRVSRSNSVPRIAPKLSKHNVLDAEYLTWSDLQDSTDILSRRETLQENKKEDELGRHKVAFSMDKSDDNKLTAEISERRISVNTLPAVKKHSKTERKKITRSKSGPSRFSELVEPFSSSSTSEVPDADAKIAQNYFSEATGSSSFIEKNGHLSAKVILRVLTGLIERINVTRISEHALNICDTLLSLPNTDLSQFFENMLKIILQIYLHMGCPNGCNEGMRTPQADFLRLKARNLLLQMYRLNSDSFAKHLKTQITDTPVQQLLDCIHAVTVFCQAEIGPNRDKLMQNRRRSSAFQSDIMTVPSYRNHFNETHSGIEGVFINTMLLPLTSKLMLKTNEMFLPENMGLYQDVRMFASYVEENHGNPFRRTALSALAAKINIKDETNGSSDTKSLDNSDSDSFKQGLYVNNSHSRDNASLRRGLFKKREETINDKSDVESSPSTPRDVPSAEDSISTTGSPLLQQQCQKQQKKAGGKLQFAFNLLKPSVKTDASEDENWNEDALSNNINPDEMGDDSPFSSSFDSRSARMSFKNAASKVNYFRHKQSLGSELSEIPPERSNDTAAFMQSYLPPKRLVHILDVREGARRFAFLLETSKPGKLPDAPLISALSELKAPVLSRAVILLECAHFVHRCNKGDWPEWIRSDSVQNRSIGGNMYSSTGGNASRITSGSRRMFLMQRAAGRNFYEWAIQIGARLQMALDTPPKEKQDKKQLKLIDDLENFLDDGTVNGNNDDCPVVLQLIACSVLYEVTAFLREAFQFIPRAKTIPKTHGSNSGWEKLMSHRRWSILSNTFNQQAGQTGSVHSINEMHGINQERRVSYSTADEESSPRGSHDLVEDTTAAAGGSTGDKKVRRLAQGRQRLLKKGSPLGQHSTEQQAGHKNRESSFRLRKQSKSPAIDNDENINESVLRQRDSLKPSTSKQSSSTGNHDDAFVIQQRDVGIGDHFSPDRRTVGSHSSQHGPPPPTAAGQHHIEDEEEEMLKNMPWIRTMIDFSKKFDMNCTHKNYCTTWCYERVYRQSHRMVEALNVVYDPSVSTENFVDKRKKFVEAWQAKQDQTSAQKRVSNPRRESAIVRQSGVEKVPLALRGLLIEKLNECEETKSAKKENAFQNDAPIDPTELSYKRPPMINFLRNQMLSFTHVPLSLLLKAALVMTTDQYKTVFPIAWRLLIHNDVHVVATAASMFICCSVKCSDDCINLIRDSLSNADATVRTEAVRRFFALWRHRFHVWLKMEEGAQLVFKVPPPSIDFTLPSPPIGQSQLPIVDPPWMPHMKTKVEELSLKEEEHSTSQTIMTMTRTRRKQKQEMVKRAIREAEERQCELRQQFPLRATAIVQQAAYEPALFYHQITAQQQQQQAAAQNTDGSGDDDILFTQNRHQMPVAQPLFPSAILSVVPQLIEMIDDVQVDSNGVSVSDTCKKVIWNCVIEDSSLFLRHFLEKLTTKNKQEYLISLLRKVILTFRPLPSQTAYVLLNYMFGFIMFYVRSPSEGTDTTLGHALSLVWLVAPYVHGLYFKDLKQTLKKEQCDQAIMITANVPSAKKIIVHGPDSGSGGIPSQFPIHEDTQFQQILTDSLEFFNIPEEEMDYFFLIDTKSGMIHNPSSYVRDFYFFHRSFYPQLTLAKLDPVVANLKMSRSAFQQKLIEIGKVLLTHNALKYSPETVIPQRIFFLHDEFTHLPSFPRRSLETGFGMYQGPLGDELHSIDSMHKYVWSKLMSDMFEKMENAFMFGDLHLFINVINGIMIIHCEDLLILRRCMATYLTMAIHFNTLFATQGFFLIMPTILRCYSQRQTNRLFTQVIEFVCKQFYILHRKPFLLQMFGSVAEICDQNNNDFEINAMMVKAKYLFNLMRSMENMNELVDQLDILSLVPYSKPLKALDLCYRDDPNTFFILTDALASCVTVCAFSPESRRSHQMLLIMQALMPYYIQFLEKETAAQSNSPSAVKHEVHSYNTLCVEMKALINSCETLSRGPTRTFDIVTSVSDRGKSFIADSPQFFDPPTVVEEEKPTKDKKPATQPAGGWDSNAMNTEIEKELFRGPRDALLTLSALFIEKAGARLKDLTKLASSIEHLKVPELLDHKCHVKLSEIALSLLKIAPYDTTTMGCQGLQQYFLVVLQVADWSVETNRSALTIILRRLDKTVSKIAKKPSIRRRANWTAIKSWLTGLYNTLVLYPYIAHMHPVKTITQTCLRLTVGDPCSEEVVTGQQPYSNLPSSTILNNATPPQSFCGVVLKLTSFLMQALGQFAFSLEFVCSYDGIGAAADRLEAVLCHVLIPLFLKAAMPGKDSPQFQQKDIGYCLTIIQNTISPPFAKQTLTPATSATLATSLMRGTTHDTAGRQGSVSVTDRGHSATVSTHRVLRDSVIQSIFLALKTMILSFQKQMSFYWAKIARIVKDLVAKRVGGHPLYAFVDFLLQVNLPISLIIVPIVHNKLTQKPLTEFEAHWQQTFLDEVTRPKPGIRVDSIRSYYSMLTSLNQELQTMKEEFSTRPIEFPRSHTPTVGDLHSDSGSNQSGGTHRSSYNRPLSGNDPRRLSSTTFSKFRKSTATECAPHNIQDTTILEDTEDDNGQIVSRKLPKSPSLPFNRGSGGAQGRTRSIGGLGMWRSIRRKSRFSQDESNRNAMELSDLHRRTRSWNKKPLKPSISEDAAMHASAVLNEPQARSDASVTSNSRGDIEKGSLTQERQRIVSFSTPKKSTTETISETESDEFCITSRQHLI